MLRTIKLALLAIIALCLITMAFANKGIVQISLLPAEMGAYAGFNLTISLPLYAVIFASVALGVFVGYILEWLREHKHRAEATRKRQEAAMLKSEVDAMKSKQAKDDGKDEVLALLEDASPAR